MTIDITTVSEGDWPLLLSIEQSCHAHPMSANQFRSCLQGRYGALKACENGEILGFAIGETVLDEATLIDIAVSPEQRRRGIARQLLEALVQRWVDAGIKSIFLEVRASNRQAIALYDATGFNEIGVRRGYYPAAGGREDAIVMACQLAL